MSRVPGAPGVPDHPRVLVVDDDPSIRAVIAFVLGDEGYQVEEAGDGQSALDLIDQRHPDIILLDMRMPGMDGWEFVQHYRRRHDHEAPIIVFTAAHDAAQRGADVQAESYIAKPFDLEDLVERVAAMLAVRNADASSPSADRAG